MKRSQCIHPHTNIPVPTVHCHSEDDDAYFSVTTYVEGVSMTDLKDYHKSFVGEELRSHLATLQTLNWAIGNRFFVC